MGLGQIISMLMRMFAKQLLNRGIRAASRGPQRRGPRRGGTQGAAHQAGKRSRQALEILRRLGR